MGEKVPYEPDYPHPLQTVSQATDRHGLLPVMAGETAKPPMHRLSHKIHTSIELPNLAQVADRCLFSQPGYPAASGQRCCSDFATRLRPKLSVCHAGISTRCHDMAGPLSGKLFLSFASGASTEVAFSIGLFLQSTGDTLAHATGSGQSCSSTPSPSGVHANSLLAGR